MADHTALPRCTVHRLTAEQGVPSEQVGQD